MAAGGTPKLGVVGVGRLWEARHRPALRQPYPPLRVTACFDQVARRAEREAELFRARAASSLRGLIFGADVEAVAFVTRQWFHPLGVEWAIEAGRPVFVAVDPVDDWADYVGLVERMTRTEAPVFLELERRHLPALRRLIQLREERLGPIHHIRFTLKKRVDATRTTSVPPAEPAVGLAIETIAGLRARTPRRVEFRPRAFALDDAGGKAQSGWRIDFADDVEVEVVESDQPRWSLAIRAEAGEAVWDGPNSIRWRETIPNHNTPGTGTSVVGDWQTEEMTGAEAVGHDSLAQFAAAIGCPERFAWQRNADQRLVAWAQAAAQSRDIGAAVLDSPPRIDSDLNSDPSVTDRTRNPGQGETHS
ncbi:oxidoreductase domain protein [Isosphaera pallida ATCC 43644]|uniref:Oxidoreductase domain protein n=1 Tax=Isosphaera pallida (strain ATCC 43644 / DSM 9630 / IS1B) TaxID=575540 RepID=E8QYG0_ISOPI|nr:Gfo/Idh/MocA family oxidoreductase [Isosphaera pallida]ADV64143.1 oxidoreductase domain protein [Isosphaera pallida ATCC 43644]